MDTSYDTQDEKRAEEEMIRLFIIMFVISGLLGIFFLFLCCHFKYKQKKGREDGIIDPLKGDSVTTYGQL